MDSSRLGSSKYVHNPTSHFIHEFLTKYASSDPEVVVRVGDWSRITQGKRILIFWRRKDTFCWKEDILEDNIDLDGKAKVPKIPDPIEYDGGASTEGETWVVSQNAEQVDVSSSGGADFKTKFFRIPPAIAQCKVKGAFKFPSGRGAILVMENTTLTCIDPSGALRGLLKDRSMRGFVTVAEVHCCSSYARMLTTQADTTVALGTPVSGVALASAGATWVRNVSSGNFRSQVNKKGERKFYLLFRLVSLTEKATSTGLRGESYEDTVAPLPDAELAWDAHLEIVQKPTKFKK
ncbi:hypothetical protein K438DRAFT_1910089 [Mycena galopus ATCC 62051]|nr:hypothetical protein K438DRAFT_1910089 [Mycena galopus ATCC 62051]